MLILQPLLYGIHGFEGPGTLESVPKSVKKVTLQQLLAKDLDIWLQRPSKLHLFELCSILGSPWGPIFGQDGTVTFPRRTSWEAR